ncbi:MAG: hypothetical protein RI993_827 [Pseudomonadota bacterium]|jgi:hypothetical protein
MIAIRQKISAENTLFSALKLETIASSYQLYLEVKIMIYQ